MTIWELDLPQSCVQSDDPWVVVYAAAAYCAAKLPIDYEMYGWCPYQTINAYVSHFGSVPCVVTTSEVTQVSKESFSTRYKATRAFKHAMHVRGMKVSSTNSTTK